MSIKWDTRTEFINEIKDQYPGHRNDDDLELYEKVIDQYPVYQNEIAENYEIEGQPIPADSNRKTWSDAFAEKLGGQIAAATKSTGNEEISFAKKLFGSKKLSDRLLKANLEIFLGIPNMDFAGGEFFTGIPSLVETAEIYRAGKAVEEGRADEKQENIIKSLAIDAQRPQSKGYKVWKTALEIPQYMVAFMTPGGAMKSIGKKMIFSGMDDAAKAGLKKAGHKAVRNIGMGLVDDSFEGGFKLSLRNLAYRAPVRAALAPQMWLDEQLTRMTPSFHAEGPSQGDIDQFKLTMVDDGDDFWEALAKAYASTTVEMFSEETARFLPIFRTMYGNKGASAGYKAAILERFLNKNQASTLRKFNQTMAKGGYHGVLEEMFEERVADWGRLIVPGLEGQILPSFDQLTTEALAFAIPGAAYRGAHYARGGEGFRQMAQNEALIERLEKVETEEERAETYKLINEAIDKSSNPYYRGFEAMEKLFGVEKRGSIRELLSRSGYASLKSAYEYAEAEHPGSGPAAVRQAAERDPTKPPPLPAKAKNISQRLEDKFDKLHEGVSQIASNLGQSAKEKLAKLPFLKDSEAVEEEQAEVIPVEERRQDKAQELFDEDYEGLRKGRKEIVNKVLAQEDIGVEREAAPKVKARNLSPLVNNIKEKNKKTTEDGEVIEVDTEDVKAKIRGMLNSSDKAQFDSRLKAFLTLYEFDEKFDGQLEKAWNEQKRTGQIIETEAPVEEAPKEKRTAPEMFKAALKRQVRGYRLPIFTAKNAEEKQELQSLLDKKKLKLYSDKLGRGYWGAAQELFIENEQGESFSDMARAYGIAMVVSPNQMSDSVAGVIGLEQIDSADFFDLFETDNVEEINFMRALLKHVLSTEGKALRYGVPTLMNGTVAEVEEAMDVALPYKDKNQIITIPIPAANNFQGGQGNITFNPWALPTYIIEEVAEQKLANAKNPEQITNWHNRMRRDAPKLIKKLRREGNDAAADQLDRLLNTGIIDNFSKYYTFGILGRTDMSSGANYIWSVLDELGLGMNKAEKREVDIIMGQEFNGIIKEFIGEELEKATQQIQKSIDEKEDGEKTEGKTRVQSIIEQGKAQQEAEANREVQEELLKRASEKSGMDLGALKSSLKPKLDDAGNVVRKARSVTEVVSRVLTQEEIQAIIAGVDISEQLSSSAGEMVTSSEDRQYSFENAINQLNLNLNEVAPDEFGEMDSAVETQNKYGSGIIELRQVPIELRDELLTMLFESEKRKADKKIDKAKTKELERNAKRKQAVEGVERRTRTKFRQSEESINDLFETRRKEAHRQAMQEAKRLYGQYYEENVNKLVGVISKQLQASASRGTESAGTLADVAEQVEREQVGLSASQQAQIDMINESDEAIQNENIPDYSNRKVALKENERQPVGKSRSGETIFGEVASVQSEKNYDAMEAYDSNKNVIENLEKIYIAGTGVMRAFANHGRSVGMDELYDRSLFVTMPHDYNKRFLNIMGNQSFHTTWKQLLYSEKANVDAFIVFVDNTDTTLESESGLSSYNLIQAAMRGYWADGQGLNQRWTILNKAGDVMFSSTRPSIIYHLITEGGNYTVKNAEGKEVEKRTAPLLFENEGKTWTLNVSKRLGNRPEGIAQRTEDIVRLDGVDGAYRAVLPIQISDILDTDEQGLEFIMREISDFLSTNKARRVAVTGIDNANEELSEVIGSRILDVMNGALRNPAKAFDAGVRQSELTEDLGEPAVISGLTGDFGATIEYDVRVGKVSGKIKFASRAPSRVMSVSDNLKRAGYESLVGTPFQAVERALEDLSGEQGYTMTPAGAVTVEDTLRPERQRRYKIAFTEEGEQIAVPVDARTGLPIVEAEEDVQFGRRKAGTGKLIGLNDGQLKGLRTLRPSDLPIAKDVFNDLIDNELDRREIERWNRSEQRNDGRYDHITEEVKIAKRAQYQARLEDLEEEYNLPDNPDVVVNQQNVDALERLLAEELSKISENNNRVAIRGLEKIEEQEIRRLQSELTAEEFEQYMVGQAIDMLLGQRPDLGKISLNEQVVIYNRSLQELDKMGVIDQSYIEGKSTRYALKLDFEGLKHTVETLTNEAAEVRDKLITLSNTAHSNIHRGTIDIVNWNADTGVQSHWRDKGWKITRQHRLLANKMFHAITSKMQGEKTTVFNGVEEDVETILENYDASAAKYPGMPTSKAVINSVEFAKLNIRKIIENQMKNLTNETFESDLKGFIRLNLGELTAEQEENLAHVMNSRIRTQRRLPSYRELYKMGLIPKTFDQREIYRNLVYYLTQRSMKRRFFNNVLTTTDNDSAPFIIMNRKKNAVIKGPNGESRRVETKHYAIEQQVWDGYHTNLSKWAKEVQIPINEEGVTDTSRLSSLGYEKIKSPYAEADELWVQRGEAKRVVQTALNQGRVDNNFVRQMERFNAWSKVARLTFSMFHHAVLLENMVAATGLNAGNALFHPNKFAKLLDSTYKKMMSEPSLGARWIQDGLGVGTVDPNINIGLVNQDIQKAMNSLTQKSKYLGEKGQAVFDMKKDWDFALWGKMHAPMKILIAETMLSKRMEELQEEGTELTPRTVKRVRKEIANAVNDAFGGRVWERYFWDSPLTRQIMNWGVFAPDWTVTALEMSGLTRLPFIRKLTRSPQWSKFERDFRFKTYWPAMIALILVGLPNLMQLLIYAMFGDPEEEDSPFTFMNEGHRKGHIDITPIMRTLPGTRDNRRTYIRWGKQATEITEGWLGHPAQTIARKSSAVVQTAFEQTTGLSTGLWDMPFKDESFLTGILEADGEFLGSRVGSVVQKFVPFSLTGVMSGKSSVPSFFAPISRGASFGSMFYRYKSVLEGYANPGVWSKISSDEKKLERIDDLTAEMVKSARKNGFDGKNAFWGAVNSTRKELYAEFYKATNNNHEKKQEQLAEAIVRLNEVVDRIADQIGRMNNPREKDRG